MKKLVLLILLVILTGCSDKKNSIYQDLDNINYIKENKDIIESVIITKLTLGSHDCYNVDVDKAYGSINDLKILKKSNISVTDDYMWYTFYYSDGKKTTLYFEGPYLVDESKKNTSYTVDFKPVNLLKEDLIECNQ